MGASKATRATGWEVDKVAKQGAWRVGMPPKAENNNGIIIIIKPTTNIAQAKLIPVSDSFGLSV